MSRFIELLAVRSITSMSQETHLLTINSDYDVMKGDLVGFKDDVFLVLDRYEWLRKEDEMVKFLTNNIGIDGEVETVYRKLKKIEEDAE